MNSKIFIKSVAALMSGTVAAQIIAFSFSIILARIYSDQDFGYFSAFVGVLSILSIISTGAYDKALMFAGSSRRALSIILLVLLIASILSSAVFAGGGILKLFSVELPFGFGYVDSIILLPFAIIFLASFQVFNYSSLKSGEIRSLSWLKVGQAIVTGCVQCVGALVGMKFIVFGYVAGFIIYIPLLYKKIKNLKDYRKRKIKEATIATAKKYRHYPSYVCPNELVDVASHQIPLLIIGLLYSVSTLGQYGFAQRILAAPAAFVGQSVGQVFFKSISDKKITASGMQRLMIRVWVVMGLIGTIPFLLLFLIGENVFVWLFGSGWSDAGKMAEILAILLFFRFVSSPTSTIYYKLGLVREQFIFSVMAFAVRLTPFIFVEFEYSIFVIIMMQVIGEICIILLFNLVAFLKLKKLKLNIN